MLLYIDIDPGGGFESGYTTTLFSAPVQTPDDFELTVHEQGLLEEAGKLFGMQDAIIGYPELDKKLLIKTNDAARVKGLFADETVRDVFQSLQDFTLQVVRRTAGDDDKKESFLELNIEEAIIHPDRLRKIYRAFFRILVLLEAA